MSAVVKTDFMSISVTYLKSCKTSMIDLFAKVTITKQINIKYIYIIYIYICHIYVYILYIYIYILYIYLYIYNYLTI